MNRLCSVLVALMALMPGVSPATDGSIVIGPVHIVSVSTGRVVPGQAVRIRAGRIEQVGPNDALARDAGAVFVDGGGHCTPALEQTVEAMSRSLAGFFFGRYDIRVASLEDFEAGRDLRVVELNGVTSEATHIYDRRNTLREAWSTLCEQ